MNRDLDPDLERSGSFYVVFPEGQRTLGPFPTEIKAWRAGDKTGLPYHLTTDPNLLQRHARKTQVMSDVAQTALFVGGAAVLGVG